MKALGTGKGSSVDTFAFLLLHLTTSLCNLFRFVFAFCCIYAISMTPCSEPDGPELRQETGQPGGKLPWKHSPGAAPFARTSPVRAQQRPGQEECGVRLLGWSMDPEGRCSRRQTTASLSACLPSSLGRAFVLRSGF